MVFGNTVRALVIALVFVGTASGCTSLREVPPEQIRVAVGNEIKVETKQGEVINMTVTETGPSAVSGRECADCDVRRIAYEDMAQMEIRELSAVKTGAAVGVPIYVALLMALTGLALALIGL